MRALIAIAFALAAPHMPSTTAGSKLCARDLAAGPAHYRVYITKGRHRVSCRRARSIVRQGNVQGWRRFDTGGLWSEVWQRHDHRAVIGAILRHETNPH
jgi:hypothetical protein